MFYLLLFSCQQPTASLFQSLVVEEGEYQIKNRAIPPLKKPEIMAGDYGQMYAGGLFKMDIQSTDITYKPGRTIRMQYTVEEEVFLPLDRDGLILLSFYAHLYDVVKLLDQSSLDTSVFFPISMAVTPHLPDPSLAFFPLENAAYMPSTHAFILLSDMVEKEVPLVANAGIVAHEFGHSVFHYLTAGDVHAERLYEATSPAASSISSLDEGFADMLAALVTLDPNFIEDSLELPERNLSGEQTALGVEVLPENNTEEGLLASYDPYALGSVFAAVTWDIYEGTQDQMGTLELVFESVRSFAQMEKPTDEVALKSVGYQWLDQLVLNAEGEERFLACESIAYRFESVHTVAECL
jgi:hypothetical protein